MSPTRIRLLGNRSVFSLIFALGLVLGLSSAARADDASPTPAKTEPRKLVNVSFGFTKAFFADYNRWFVEHWKKDTGETVIIEQSHGPSGAQTEAVIAGRLAPDVITLANPSDIDNISRRTKLIPATWRAGFPNGSSPYSSAVVFLVRHGNPKAIADWSDLALPDRTLVTSTPKACGGGRWNYTAAYGLGAGPGGTPARQEEYLRGFVKNVPIFYANQGEAGDAFLKGGTGDVLLTYESFALGVTKQPDAKVDLVVPPRTVEIELPVAIAARNAAKRGTTALARAYLSGLYTPEAQELLARHNFRPRLPDVANRTADHFPHVTLVKSRDIFGSSQRAEKEHFAEGALFDAVSAQDRVSVAPTEKH